MIEENIGQILHLRPTDQIEFSPPLALIWLLFHFYNIIANKGYTQVWT